MATVDPEHMPPVSWCDYRHVADTRTEIAVLVWRIVAEFIGDRTKLTADGPLWEPAEAYIREHFAAAEAETISYGARDDEVILGVLMALELAEDYWRIKRDTQWMAFEEAEV